MYVVLCKTQLVSVMFERVKSNWNEAQAKKCWFTRCSNRWRFFFFCLLCLRSVWFSMNAWESNIALKIKCIHRKEQKKKREYIWITKTSNSNCAHKITKNTSHTLKIYCFVEQKSKHNCVKQKAKRCEKNKRRYRNNAQTWWCSSRNSINDASPWKRNVHCVLFLQAPRNRFGNVTFSLTLTCDIGYLLLCTININKISLLFCVQFLVRLSQPNSVKLSKFKRAHVFWLSRIDYLSL